MTTCAAGSTSWGAGWCEVFFNLGKVLRRWRVVWRELLSYSDGDGRGACLPDGLRRLYGNNRASGSRLSPTGARSASQAGDTCPLTPDSDWSWSKSQSFHATLTLEKETPSRVPRWWLIIASSEENNRVLECDIKIDRVDILEHNGRIRLITDYAFIAPESMTGIVKTSPSWPSIPSYCNKPSLPKSFQWLSPSSKLIEKTDELR